MSTAAMFQRHFIDKSRQWARFSLQALKYNIMYPLSQLNKEESDYSKFKWLSQGPWAVENSAPNKGF